MSDVDATAICVRKDVMDRFNTILDETKLGANELMEHFFALHSCSSLSSIPFTQQQMLQHMQQQKAKQSPPVFKTEPNSNSAEQSFGGVTSSFNSTMSDTGSKNSSMSEHDEVASAGVSNQNMPDDKVKLLQRLREQANQAPMSSHIQGYPGFQAHASNLKSPSMVPVPNAGGNFQTSTPKKKKKKDKNKVPEPGTQVVPISDGEDLLKSSMCSLCQAVFARFTDLLAHHKAVHNSDTNHPLRCRACGRTQTSEAGLIYHQVYVCKMVERPNPCHICGLKFQTEEMVLVHKCSGDPRKKYACEFCDHYRSESSSDLEKHMRIHTNDKCYVCRVCGFSTAWKKNLKEHMVKHLGLKPYSCDLCGYSTSDRHNLRQHRIKHYEKGEGCQKCGPKNCTCQPPGSGAPSRKRKLSDASVSDFMVGNGSVSPSGPGVVVSAKDLECPYPQCVYRTKIEYMMTNHMLRHQGKGEDGVIDANDGGFVAVGSVSHGKDNNNSGPASNNQIKQQHGDGISTSSTVQVGRTGQQAGMYANSSSSLTINTNMTHSNNKHQNSHVATSQPYQNVSQEQVREASFGKGMGSPSSHYNHRNSVDPNQQGTIIHPSMTWSGQLSPPLGIPSAPLNQQVNMQMTGQGIVSRPLAHFPNSNMSS